MISIFPVQCIANTGNMLIKIMFNILIMCNILIMRNILTISIVNVWNSEVPIKYQVRFKCKCIFCLKQDKKLSKMLGEKPCLQFAGSNVNLTITVDALTLMVMESGEVRLTLI